MFKIQQVKNIYFLLVLSLLLVMVLLVYVGLRHSYTEGRQQRIIARAVIKPVKVFQIGFSKCGTATIANFFWKNYIHTVHHDQGFLALSMYNNYINGKPIIGAKYNQHYVFTDMENMSTDPAINVGKLLYKELDKQYPGSKFILNIRDKNAWLKSRSLHRLGPQQKATLLELRSDLQKTTKEQVLDEWSNEWDLHNQAVLEYFKDRPDDLLVFNIEQDPPEKLVNFLKDYFMLDPKLYKHKNKTVERDMLIANSLKFQPQAKKKFSMSWLSRLVKELY